MSMARSILRIQPPAAAEAGEGAEFDFSDVFGAPPSSSAQLQLDDEDPDPSSSRWGQPELHFEGETPVIYSRSHSLVGPSPRPQLGRLWEDPQLLKPPSSDEDSDEGNPVEAEVLVKQPGDEEKQRMGPSDFELLRIVGQGAFGKVFQVRLKGTEEIYAMKVMRKDRVLEKNQADYMKAERDILTKIVHPFIVQLRCSFQTKKKLYLILDFINGGHLFFQLYRQGIFSEDVTRIYAAEIVSAVAHLHSKGIVHRDLKPENILLDADGHVKLTDFGVAKQIQESDRTNSCCGTVEYMAPEIILATGHGKEADWWSLGILLFEMLKGMPPFTYRNPQRLQKEIVKGKIKFPGYFSGDAVSLMRGLLQKDPSKRLGSGEAGSEEIKRHKWFRGINWGKLEAKLVEPKFKPAVEGRSCIANFDEKWTTLPAQDSPASTPRATDGDIFQGFTYFAPSIWLSGLENKNTPR